jgi:hypothetical protein
MIYNPFHLTRRWLRYTISKRTRREVLRRQLALNHARYAEKLRQVLPDKGSKNAKGNGKGRRLREGRRRCSGTESRKHRRQFGA